MARVTRLIARGAATSSPDEPSPARSSPAPLQRRSENTAISELFELCDLGSRLGPEPSSTQHPPATAADDDVPRPQDDDVPPRPAAPARTRLAATAGCAATIQALRGEIDAQLSATAMKIICAVLVVFGSAEDGQHIVPCPAGVAQSFPVIVVGFLATHVDHGVDRGTAADDFAARVANTTAVKTCFGFCLEAPICARITNGVEVAYGDVYPEIVVFLTRFY